MQETKSRQVPHRGGRGGRPKRDEVALREARLLEVATAMFIERGFDATTIDAVAEAAGIAKRTLYARYSDKAALFAAVLRQLIERWLVPFSTYEADETMPLEAALGGLARHILEASLKPEAIAVQRILSAQAPRFPELARLGFEEGGLKAVQATAALIRRHAERGTIRVESPELAAEQFLSLVTGSSFRRALLGMPPDRDEIERRIRSGVRLFLDGARRRPTDEPRPE